MIQPIISLSNQSYRRNLNFKNTAPQAAAPISVAEKRDIAIIDFMDKMEKTQKQNQVAGWALLGLFLPLSFLPIFLNRKKGTQAGADLTKTFRSLKDDAAIPTLDSCKSINAKLRNFLQAQVDFIKAKPEDIAAVKAKNPADRLILYGAPGTGKSFFAKIFAKTIDADYKEVLYSDINSEWAGRATANLKRIFENVLKEAKKEPNKRFVLTFNEIDTLVQPAESMQRSYARGGGGHSLTKLEERSTFLNYIDRLSEEAPNVMVIGTTNISPKNKGLDGAAMSRFKNIVEVSYPDKTCLLEALKTRIGGLENGKEFITAQEDSLDKIAQTMFERKSSFRDLDNVFEASKNYYLNDYMKDKNVKYKQEYLDKAIKSMNMTDGEVAGIS